MLFQVFFCHVSLISAFPLGFIKHTFETVQINFDHPVQDSVFVKENWVEYLRILAEVMK
jgi:hypothetical protein